MVPQTAPLASVITVNFNGERYLPGLLSALERQSYPRFEALLVDNGSTDRSVALVRREFPWVRVVEAGENLGFAGGNNLGIRQARGELIALVNNDTLPEPDWLRHLVRTATESEEIGGVGSKILFARPFVPVTLEASTFVPANLGVFPDSRRLGVFVSELSSFEDCRYRKPIFHSGFYGAERAGGEQGQWTGRRATIFLPVESTTQTSSLNLRVMGGPAPGGRRLTVSVGGTELAQIEIEPRWRNYNLDIPRGVDLQSVELINNAASFLSEDGSSGDRGIFEPDRGQYDIPEDVDALCGCAMLLSKQALREVGTFDHDFYMYFEDTELSWRLGKQGFRLRYEPKSVVRHFHASTSVEYSPLFNFLVSRNRLLMLIKHASPRIVLSRYLEELYRLLKAIRVHRSLRHAEVRTRIKVQVSLLYRGPRALVKRFGWLRQ